MAKAESNPLVCRFQRTEYGAVSLRFVAKRTELHWGSGLLMDATHHFLYDGQHQVRRALRDATAKNNQIWSKHRDDIRHAHAEHREDSP